MRQKLFMPPSHFITKKFLKCTLKNSNLIKLTFFTASSGAFSSKTDIFSFLQTHASDEYKDYSDSLVPLLAILHTVTFAQSVHISMQCERQMTPQYHYGDSFDVADLLKGSQGSPGVCRPHFGNCYLDQLFPNMILGNDN